MHLVDLNPVEFEPEPFFNPDTDNFYVLFTRRNPTAGQRITATTGSINNSQWNSNALGTRFIIHGWNQNSGSGLNGDITRAYLASGDHNVVVVDWAIGASANYVTSRNRVGPVGQSIARFIDFLHLNGFVVNFNRVIIAGHSLGAHVAGHVGKSVARGRIQAIYGLDPAGPLFSIGTPTGRLHETDAIYTESIYTDAGGLGFDEPIAHGNFYPNWGVSQPGCLTGACSHARSNLFYAESVTSNRFVSHRCLNYNSIVNRSCGTTLGTAIMGGDAAKTLTGIFFLQTNNNSPFARG